jgi:HSP20 family protein
MKMAIIRLRQPAYPGAAAAQGWGDRNYNVFQNEMNRLFQKFLGSDYDASTSGVFPPVNVYEDAVNFYLTAELPGMESSDIQLDVEENSIQIQGERRTEHEKENLCYHRKEREGGAFSRKLTFRDKIDTEKVSAALKNGVLKITMPKAQSSKPKKIEVSLS